MLDLIDLDFTIKKNYFHLAISEGKKIFYKNTTGMIFIKDGQLIGEFCDKQAPIDSHNIKYALFNIADKFLHAYKIDGDTLKLIGSRDIYGKTNNFIKAVKDNYLDKHGELFFISAPFKDITLDGFKYSHYKKLEQSPN